MHRLLYHNDKIIDAAESRISPTSAGLLYGWGVFTTLRIYDARPFAFDRHWQRLIAHAERMRIESPINLDHAKAAIEQLIAANSVDEGRARITLLRGDTGPWQIDP